MGANRSASTNWATLGYPAPLTRALVRRFNELAGGGMACTQEAVDNTAAFLRAFSSYDDFAANSGLGPQLAADGTGPAYRFLFARAARPAREWAALQYPAAVPLAFMREFVCVTCVCGLDLACEQAAVDELAACVAAGEAGIAAFAAANPAFAARPRLMGWLRAALARPRDPATGAPAAASPAG